ncbi:hypothetical protein GA0115254_110657 [Streptomyces sp. Ncost-T10-10d]|nr:hypothetical protein GA0115254_110657 [Streptomyces sp. Ncost-T10-10d]
MSVAHRNPRTGNGIDFGPREYVDVARAKEILEWGRDTDVACREGTLSEHGAGLGDASYGVNLREDAQVTVRVGRAPIEGTSSGQFPRAYALRGRTGHG